MKWVNVTRGEGQAVPFVDHRTGGDGQQTTKTRLTVDESKEVPSTVTKS